MINVPNFERLTNKRMINGAPGAVGEYAEARGFANTGSRFILEADNQRLLANWCPESEGSGDHYGDSYQYGSNGNPAIFESWFKEILGTLANIGGRVLSTLGDVCSLPLRNSEGVFGFLE